MRWIMACAAALILAIGSAAPALAFGKGCCGKHGATFTGSVGMPFAVTGTVVGFSSFQTTGTSWVPGAHWNFGNVPAFSFNLVPPTTSGTWTLNSGNDALIAAIDRLTASIDKLGKGAPIDGGGAGLVIDPGTGEIINCAESKKRYPDAQTPPTGA